MREVAPGLWDWQADHPEWEEGAVWGPAVSSHALVTGDGVLLFDPLDVPPELRGRATAVVLTAPWHERDTQKLGLPVYAAQPETAEDLLALYDVTPGQLEGFVSSDLRWLVHEGGGEFHPISAGAAPFGIEAFAGRSPHDLVFWIESARAVIAGDTLSDFGNGLEIRNEWLSAKTKREDVVDRLRPLLDKPVEVVLSAHGLPTDMAALERALS
jgi:glyoxylase-like metal-dependent hydrolase (beta-lactamase superfamily II)